MTYRIGHSTTPLHALAEDCETPSCGEEQGGEPQVQEVRSHEGASTRWWVSHQRDDTTVERRALRSCKDDHRTCKQMVKTLAILDRSHTLAMEIAGLP